MTLWPLALALFALSDIETARKLVRENRIAEALAELERVLAASPDPDVKFQAGKLLRELAEQRAAHLAKVAPGSPAVHEMTGERLELEGKLEEALAEYRAAGSGYRTGTVLWKLRRLDEAADALKAEVTRAPHHAMANLRLGEVLIAKGEEPAAIPYLERAAAAMLESMEARRELGKAYRKAGRTADARRVWEEVARARPEDGQVHFLLGSLYREMGQMDLSRREMERHRRILERRRQASEKR